MKPSGILLIAGILAPCILHAQERRVWEFEGIGVTEAVGCSNNPTTRYGYTWREKTNNPRFSADQKKRADSLSEVYKGHSRLTNLTVTSDRDIVIAVVQRHILCGQPNGPRKMVKSYKFVSGADSASIVRGLSRDVETSVMKDLKGFEIIEVIKLKVKDMVIPPGSKSLPAGMTAIGVRG